MKQDESVPVRKVQNSVLASEKWRHIGCRFIKEMANLMAPYSEILGIFLRECQSIFRSHRVDAIEIFEGSTNNLAKPKYTELAMRAETVREEVLGMIDRRQHNTLNRRVCLMNSFGCDISIIGPSW
jgi:hypothetical protein